MTNDNYEVQVGDSIWVQISDNVFEHRVVGRITSSYKISYDWPDENGFIGAKRTICWHNPLNALSQPYGVKNWYQAENWQPYE